MNMNGLISKVDRLRAMKRGKGIQYVLDETYRICGNPVVVFDMSYALIASSASPENDDPLWNELVKTGRFSQETLEFFKDESFIDAVANSAAKDGITYLISDKLKYDRIFGQIYGKKNVPVADLCVVACERPFDDETPDRVRALCQLLSKEFSKNDALYNYGQAYYQNVLELLLGGNIIDKELYAGHVANIDKGFGDNIFVAVVDTSRASPPNPIFYRDLFARVQPAYKYAVYDDRLVIVLSAPSASADFRNGLPRLSKLFESHGLYAGICGRFDNLYELRKHYRGAAGALEDGLKNIKNGEGKRIFIRKA